MSPEGRKAISNEALAWAARFVDRQVIDDYPKEKREFVTNAIAGHVMAVHNVTLAEAKELAEEALSSLARRRR